MRSRGLPDDHVGPVRVVDIKDIDSNLCCGTHISNLSDLQVCRCSWAASGATLHMKYSQSLWDPETVLMGKGEAAAPG